LRKEKSLTQDELASLAELTRPSIVHIEQGKQRLPIDRLYRIALALQVSINELLPDVDSVMPSSTKNKELSLDSLSEGKISGSTKEKLLEIMKEAD